MDVSVVCPVFNTSAELLGAAIRSVLEQSGPHDCELILVDDASTDPATLKALHEAEAGGRVRVIYQAKNAGPGPARAAGMRHAVHDWIGFIDSDDLWPEGKLDRAQAVLREQPGTRWIGGGYASLHAEGELRPFRFLMGDGPQPGDGRPARLSSPALTRALIGGWVPLGANLLRKDLIAETGGFHSSLIYGEDWLLCLQLSIRAPMDYLREVTYVLRRQGASMMHSPARMSAKLVHSVQVARRDPALRIVRRELRWFCYGTYKDIAMNNALNGRRLRGLAFALRALWVDPRELREFAFYLKSLRSKGPALAGRLGGYSTAEQVILSALPPSAH